MNMKNNLEVECDRETDKLSHEESFYIKNAKHPT